MEKKQWTAYPTCQGMCWQCFDWIGFSRAIYSAGGVSCFYLIHICLITVAKFRNRRYDSGNKKRKKQNKEENKEENVRVVHATG